MQNREQRIRDLAYRLWIEEGRPDGRAQQHWDLAADMIDADDGRLRAIHAAEPADLALSAVAMAEGKGAPKSTAKVKAARVKPPAKRKAEGKAVSGKAEKSAKPAKATKGEKSDKAAKPARRKEKT